MIGKGSYGSVYLYQNLNNLNYYAVKEMIGNKKDINMFKKEIKTGI